MEYSFATQEEIAEFRRMLADTDFTPEGDLKVKVMDIIMDELASYFGGDKELEDVTGIIQNKVSTLLEEN